MTAKRQKGIFVSHRVYFEGGRGGAQICSAEYFDTIGAAGIDLSLSLLDFDRRVTSRVIKRLQNSLYDLVASPSQIKKLLSAIDGSQPDFVFLNQVNLAALADPIRRVLRKGAKIILLSHGLESTDLLHTMRVRKELRLEGVMRRHGSSALGNALVKESELRKYVDGVLVLSPLDAMLEAWLGGEPVVWLPRTVTEDRLAWRPIGNRLGFIGTIDHAPNLEGIVRATEAIDVLNFSEAPRIRVVGGPISCGEWLQRKHPSVEYLGPLPPAEARREAETWSAFLHPIFCAARGCSTKLAEAIGWGIPIVTTEHGHRGYAWREGSFAIGNTPGEFARKCVELMSLEAADRAQQEVLRIRASSPTRTEIAGKIASFLEDLSIPAEDGRSPAGRQLECS